MRRWNRNSVLIGSVLVGAIALAGCSSSDSTTATHEDTGGHTGTEVHFSYTGETGPLHWGSLDTEWEVCGTGDAVNVSATYDEHSTQSPIDIVTAGVALRADNGTNAKAIDLSGYTTPTDWTIANNGHTVQVSYPTGGGEMAFKNATLGDKHYELLQYHFHTTSEHSVDGASYAMEMHLVHKEVGADGHDVLDAEGNNVLAVLGVLFDDGTNYSDLGADNPFLASMLSNTGLTTNGGWPEETDTVAAAGTSMDVAYALPTTIPATLAANGITDAMTFYNYTGSLTTPPCTESVQDWLVLAVPVTVSHTQASDFMAAIGGHHNNRPIQELNGRTVTMGMN
ncbi:MAG: carbonic anhydrase family protein [Proteobacteria bacterium]|nr:carbonic anhydrase family protein [Pseudomonadota bacterium]MBU1687516.1 carbonic anhydrase family protein [Pseudomonadota bacterium]